MSPGKCRDRQDVEPQSLNSCFVSRKDRDSPECPRESPGGDTGWQGHLLRQGLAHTLGPPVLAPATSPGIFGLVPESLLNNSHFLSCFNRSSPFTYQ